MNSPPPHPTGPEPNVRPPLNTQAESIGDLGRYRLLSRLAVGGMAEIFLAKVEGIGGFEKVVVVKRMIPQYAEDPVLVRMFMDEARLLAKLDHPNITQVHDVGTQGGQYYFAMEFVHGEDLRAITRAAALNGVSLGDSVIASIISNAAKALHYVHEKCADDGRSLNIVHRDVSPSNVLVGFNGTVKLADFGVAKWDDQQTSTTHGTLKGKLAYMSPEQAKGAAVDRRSDIFSLGVLMFELFTGTRLFQGATEMAILEQVTSGATPNPTRRRPDLPKSIEAVILRALAPLPHDRFATAQDLARVLDVFVASDPQPCDPQTISTLLTKLFSQKLATWHEAEQGGLTLAEHLARLPVAEVLPVLTADANIDDNNTKPAASNGERRIQSPLGTNTRWAAMLAWSAGAIICVVTVTSALWPNSRPAPTRSQTPVQVPAAEQPTQPTANISTPTAKDTNQPAAVAALRPLPAEVAHKKKRSFVHQRPSPTPLESAVKPNDVTKVRVWDPDSVLLPK